MNLSPPAIMECPYNLVGSVTEGGRPEWVTAEDAHLMAEQVCAAVMEAGHPDVQAHRHDEANYYFTGAPDDVLIKAGQLVRAHWGFD